MSDTDRTEGSRRERQHEPLLLGAAAGRSRTDGVLQSAWRHRWLVGLGLLVGMALVGAYLYRATPMYTSVARVYVEQKEPRMINPAAGVMTESMNYLFTQCELITSSPLLERVMQQEGIGSLATFAGVEDPTGLLKRKLKVTVGDKDDIISIALSSAYPEEAARIVNAVVVAYIGFHASHKRSTANEIRDILEVGRLDLNKQIEEKQKELLAFRDENDVLALQRGDDNLWAASLSLLLESAVDARRRATKLRGRYKAAQRLGDNWGKVKLLLETDRAGQAVVAGQSNAQLNQLRQLLQVRRQELAQLRERFTDEVSAMGGKQNEIEGIEAQIAEVEKQAATTMMESLAENIRLAEEDQKDMEGEYEAERAKAAESSRKRAEYEFKLEGLTLLKTRYGVLTDRIGELDVTKDAGPLNIQVVEQAQVAGKPSHPQKTRVVGLGLVFGLVLGLGLALIRDMTDQRLQGAEEIAAAMGGPIVGAVPAVRGRSAASCGQVVHLDPSCPVSEAYKGIRTALYFSAPNGQAKTILVTSPAPGDGKSTLVSNLASAMAQAGQQVLVMDCDFRNPVQHTIFEVDREPGISDALAGDGEVARYVKRTREPNLDVLTCGPILANPSEMLNSEAFAAVLEEVTGRYDRVLLDSPPVTAVSDARILAAMSDVTLVVVRADKTRRLATEQTRGALASVGARVLGTVVNDVRRGADRYGQYAGYGEYRRYWRWQQAGDQGQWTGKKESSKQASSDAGVKKVDAEGSKAGDKVVRKRT